MHKQVFGGVIAVSLASLAMVMSGSPAQAAPAASDARVVTAPAPYILGPADVIEVSVLGRNDFTTKGRIDGDGTFRVPFIGSIAAANRTAVQLSDDIARALDAGGYFAHPIVKVEVASYASRYVTVMGAIVHPDLVTVDRTYRLSEIMARAGGVKEGGADYVVYIPKNGAHREITLEAMAIGGGQDDPYVSPGDKIYVPDAALFYISGQVKAPGAIPLKRDMTYRMAISRAGGLTDSGSDKSVTVTRDGKKTAHINIDSKVMPGDIVVIGERLF